MNVQDLLDFCASGEAELTAKGYRSASIGAAALSGDYFSLTITYCDQLRNTISKNFRLAKTGETLTPAAQLYAAQTYIAKLPNATDAVREAFVRKLDTLKQEMSQHHLGVDYTNDLEAIVKRLSSNIIEAPDA